LSVLRQNHFDYEEERAIDVVIMGNEQLYNIMKEKDAIYMKADFSEEDGVRQVLKRYDQYLVQYLLQGF
ncbi:TPA: hypothetical protein ACQOVO_001775, partial [Streptococcus pyogenes]